MNRNKSILKKNHKKRKESKIDPKKRIEDIVLEGTSIKCEKEEACEEIDEPFDDNYKEVESEIVKEEEKFGNETLDV